VSGPAPSIAVRPPIAAEEQARADVYALLSRLWSQAPDAGLLRALGAAPRLPAADEGAGWPEAFNRLADASSVMDAGAAAQEYTDLFIGVGHSEVDLHASYWLAGGERPLPELRRHLGELGLGRRPDAALMEDHLGALLETMRLLVAGRADVQPAPVAVQAAFFERWLAPWTDRCCTAIDVCSIANYYRRVAECTKIFLALERDSFAIG
jgi:TorA maturation chaperone TorD